MRELDYKEAELVSGGAWEFEADFGITKIVFKGDESVQDMASAVATVASGAYGAAVAATTDLFEWMANGWNYSAACSGGYWY